MPSEKELAGPKLNTLLVLATAALWLASSAANLYLMSFTRFAPGIDLVYLPAGFRLAIVLVFGVWGALGIFLSNPLLYLAEFGAGSATQVMVNSLICGFAPFLTVKAFCRAAGVQGNLLQLRPVHLPLLAFAVSIVTPLLLNLNFLMTDLKQPSEFLPNLTAMMTGDFLGCLLVIILLRLAIATVRTLWQPQ